LSVLVFGIDTGEIVNKMDSHSERLHIDHRKPGEVVALRWVRNAPADLVAPVRVVEHDANRTILFLAKGSPLKVHADRDGNYLPRSIPLVEREREIASLADGTWLHNHTLMIHEPHRLGAVWLFWSEADWSFKNYYVNLQAPLEMSPAGFDTADYWLDIVVAPYLSWRWKDEDEFAIAIEHELISPVLLHAARAEGRRFIDEIESRQFPFGHGLESWRPEPGWDVPELPENWDEGLAWPD
jgi:uncharacterized protein